MSEGPDTERLYPRWGQAAVALAWVKSGLILVAAVALAVGGGGNDPAGRAYLYGGFVIGGTYWLLVILPALLLLRRPSGRRVGLGFALLILPGLILTAVAALA